MKSPIRWSVVHWAVLATIIIAIVAAFWLFFQIRREAIDAFEHDALRQATAASISPHVVDAWLADLDALQDALVELSLITGADVSALSTRGEILAQSNRTSEENPAAEPANWSSLPELRAVLVGRDGTSTRQRDGSAASQFFVAKLVRDQGTPLGVLHFAFPRDQLLAGIAKFSRLIALAALISTVLLSVTFIALTQYLTNGIRHMTRVVESITGGNLDARVRSIRHSELGELAEAFNRMADKLQRQMKKRAREKDRLNTVMHVMTDGVIILNRSGTVKLINPAGAHVLNTTVEKAMNRSFVQAVRDHRVAEVWKRCQISGVEEVAAIELGVTQFVRVIVTPFLGKAGRGGYLVMLQDLTQMRRLQTVRQDFISNVSHELRTPLASLRALVETLRDSALDDPPAAAHFLDRMEIEVDALTQMVEELLELSRIESGQVPLRLNPVLPYSVVVPPVERLRAQAERNQLHLLIDVPRDMPLVLVDAGRIHQVVTNIVHNAIKFTPPEGTIRLSASYDATTVTIAVEDNGIGIASNDLPRIFERFFKTDRSRAVGGTGLGLAIAKHIVQAHDGAIWAVSQEGQGSTFYFTMPRAEPEAMSDVMDSIQRSTHNPAAIVPVNESFTIP